MTTRADGPLTVVADTGMVALLDGKLQGVDGWLHLSEGLALYGTTLQALRRDPSFQKGDRRSRPPKPSTTARPIPAASSLRSTPMKSSPTLASTWHAIACPT